ncbi:MAG: hypothetical protein HYZ28_11940 [Myxococcales bacterium]|nr:hypothetical protein [Myxococcales bacterium]
MEQALFMSRKPRSSARYRTLAERVGLDACTDPAFQKLREVLAAWFPQAA